MKQPHIDDHVRLTHDVPELSLRRGDSGVVKSIWFEPMAAYEVEFPVIDPGTPCRCLLWPDQVEVNVGPPQEWTLNPS